MEMDMMPLFNNSCGKVFKDKVILASPNRENHIKFDNIKKLEFVTRISFNSLLWVLISCSFFFILYLERNLEGWIYFLIFAVALGFTILSLVMVEKNYHILLRLNDGSEKKITVSKDNKKDAKKFVAVAMKKHNT
ncbi:hypothetical protein D3C87_427790 [compost metagenome]